MERIKWIDSLKGFAIILMVIGHYQDTPHLLNVWIYSFHMPLFFFLSGYLTEHIKKKYIQKKFKTLMIPYFSFGLLMLCVDYFLKQEIDIYKEFLNIIYYIWRPAMWFFWILFACCAMFYYCNKLSIKLKCFIVILCYTISVLTSKFNMNLPFRIEIFFSAFSFFLLGDILRSRIKQLFLINKKEQWFICSIFFAIFTVIALQFPKIDLLLNELHPLYGIVSIISIISFILLFQSINQSILKNSKSNNIGFRILQYCSLNAIVILIFHSKVFYLCDILYSHIHLNNMIIKAICTILIEICILVPLIYIFNNYLYCFLGKTKRSHQTFTN